ncbi:ABC transporter permease [Chelatococcus asaccharovorans]|uniref:ABC transporter permease n=1 Tax=Chelatococcus asaccharovorans TaxID=28210 RepID=UPI00224C6F81|nr:ABC transporter permease [Chelatococcus asaccharovorans]CAH1657552.1 Peptide/nickel transport system permease protein [Chelatococcus asaccharovorans]CAH1687628.1 Peptide/nickel transport system permease protein [Chelatococcus asaccharovorans]
MRSISFILRHWTTALGILLLAAVILMALTAHLVFPGDPYDMVGAPLTWPGESADTILGTDSLGRDMAAGLFYGARVSLLVGFASALVAAIVGVLVGAFAGYYGGWTDDVLMRITELFQTTPQFMLALAVVAVLGPSVTVIILSLSAVSWPAVARLVRGEFMVMRERAFVHGCVVAGMSDLRIIFAQILPNVLPVIIVMSTILVATAILMESALSFLGFGDPNVLTWGTMIGMGRGQLRDAWYIIAIPGVALLLTALALNLVGEGLNDALNPRLKQRKG